MSNTSSIIRSPLQRLALSAALFSLAALFLLPIFWMLITTGKTLEQANSGTLSILPDPAGSLPTNVADNFSKVWTDPAVTFPVYLRNTLVVAVLSVTGMTLSSAIVAYGFARINFRFRGGLFALLLATMMIPFPVVMAPLYLIFRELHWIGTLKPLWVPAWFGGAFSIFLLRQFYMQIPRELDEAARIDGCGHWGIFARIILPLSTPALAVVALFHFLHVWNDFLGPLIFLNHRDQFTLALGLQLYQTKAGGTPVNLLMTAATMVVAPVLLLFVLAQSTFIKGVASDGLKE